MKDQFGCQLYRWSFGVLLWEIETGGEHARLPLELNPKIPNYTSISKLFLETSGNEHRHSA